MELMYALGAVTIVSLISLIGIIGLFVKETFLKRVLIYLVSFAAGALFGDVFLHLLPELIEEGQFTSATPFYILSGIVFSFILEKIIHWRHCHLPFDQKHVHRFAYMNFFGDALHNLIDGLIIGASFLVGIPVGIATTMAVILHEIPQEIGDFAVLIHGGFSRYKALFLNFITALTAIAGVIIAFGLNTYMEDAASILVPLAAGNFIYIAGSDLIPELHKEEGLKKSVLQLLMFVAGMAVMALLLLGE